MAGIGDGGGYRGEDGDCKLIGLPSAVARWSYSESLIDRCEHLIETRKHHDLDQAVLAPLGAARACRSSGTSCQAMVLVRIA